MQESMQTVQLTANVMSTNACLGLNLHSTCTWPTHILQVLECLASTRIHHSRVSFHKDHRFACSLILYQLLVLLAKRPGLVIMQQYTWLFICTLQKGIILMWISHWWPCARKQRESDEFVTTCMVRNQVRISVANCHVVYSLNAVLVVQGYH